MKNIVKISLFIMLVSFANLAYAHSNHGTVTEEQVVKVANKTIQKMTFKDFGFDIGKLPKKWKKVTNENIKIVNVIDGFHIVEASLNDSEKIYLKISPNGQVIEAKSINFFE